MRFLEFLSCGRKPSRRPKCGDPSRAAEGAAVVGGNLSPTTGAGVTEGVRSNDKRRQRAASDSVSASGAHWRPMLRSISEDGMLLREAAAAEEKRSRPRSAASTERARGRGHRNEYRHYTPPVVVPSFTPTAFLF